MQCPLQKAAKSFGSSTAIIASKKIITYKQFDHLVTVMVKGLNRIPIKRGMRVGIISPSNAEVIILLFALWRKGAVTAIMNPQTPASALKSQLQSIGADICFQYPFQIGQKGSRNSRLPSNPAKISVDQEATILFTSGSSGNPKVVLHTYGNHYYNALGSNENISLKPGDRWLLSLPLYHVSGLSILFRCLLSGAAVVISKNENFDNVTHISLVTTQLYRLLQNKKNDSNLRKLKSILVGGGPIPNEYIQQSLKRGWKVFITYGLTEAASQVATSTPEDHHRKSINSAKILKFRKVKISQNGEIFIKGKVLFKGYLHQNKMEQPLAREGWFATGDLGEWMAPNRLRIIGRKDNMFISGGENIYPEEIECHLSEYAGIEEAIVVSRPDKEFGRRPVAFIRSDATIHSKELSHDLQKSLPKFKIPDAFYRWPNQSATTIKSNRRQLQRLLVNSKHILEKIR